MSYEVVTRQNIRDYAKMLAEDVLKILDKPEHREMQGDIALAALSLRLEVTRFVEKVAGERGLRFEGCDLEDLAILAALKAIALRE
ncbi:MAG: hypothetical protein J7K36_05420 [Archaeoglobaceae archaeon]|nr:hypothetical protein [Archaeoglobaceae archaeon]